jgi:REP element-mobilizing transposase RayT
MVRPLRLHVPGAIYHVISRGNGRQRIFLTDRDRRTFLTRLAAAARRFALRCHAYCLMPNHFHLIVRVNELPLPRAMQQLNSAYAQWFNWRHRRVGHVFQGRYKALLIENGEYFRRVLRYVARNPVRAGLVRHPADWRWSSYRMTAGLQAPDAWLALDEVWNSFDPNRSGTPRAACRAYIDYCGETEFGPDDGAEDATLVFGSPASAGALSESLAQHRQHREFVYAERYADRPPLEALFAQADSAAGRQLATRHAFDDHGYTLREIADFLGVAPTTVWRHARGVVREWRVSPKRNGKDQDLTL